MDIISAFGEAVKDIIDDGEITVEQFAEKINLNSSEVYRFLRKERLPQLSTIIAIADGYNCSVDYLLGQEEDIRTRLAEPVSEGGTTEQERELLRYFRELSQYLKGMTMEAVKSWAKKGADGEQKKV